MSKLLLKSTTLLFSSNLADEKFDNTIGVLEDIMMGKYEPSCQRHLMYFFRSKAMAKLGGMSCTTLYSAYLPGCLNMRVTRELHVPKPLPCCRHKTCFCCLPETFARLLLQILFHAAKFSRWLNWETPRGHQCHTQNVS